MNFPLMKNNISRDDLDKVIAHLKNDDPQLTHGKYVQKFEEEWSKWLGVKYSIFVNSGSSANLITISILKGLYPDGGEIIVPPLTWVSDIAAILQNGFIPRFVDIDPDTLSLDNSKTIDNINDNTVAVFITHVQGFNGLSEKLIKELNRRKIHLIEDVCESHGASFNGKKLGTFGFMSNFSFYYAHHMSTIEGGMVCTNDYNTYQNLRLLRSHGMVRESTSDHFKDNFKNNHPDLNPDFIFAMAGYNVRNTEIGGLLGLNQLKRLDENIKIRNYNHELFLSLINPSIYKTKFKLDGSSNYAFQLILNEPDNDLVNKLMEVMHHNNIEFRRGSAGGGNQLRQPYLKNIIPLNYHANFPQTEHIHFYGFYIGNYPELNDSKIKTLCKILNSV